MKEKHVENAIVMEKITIDEILDNMFNGIITEDLNQDTSEFDEDGSEILVYK